MSNFPTSYDDDSTLPCVNNNITEIGDEAINACRDAIFQIEYEVGIGAAGTAGSIADRIGVCLNPSGTLKTSAIAGLGLVTLPIYNSEIADDAAILESKLKLDYRTSDLFNYIRECAANINTALGWISLTGAKVAPHLAGSAYKHSLSHINVSTSASDYFLNRFLEYRDNTNSYTAINDINDELLAHQFADGYNISARSIITNNGGTLSVNYAHPASGIFLDASRFAMIPQTTEDLQTFAEYIDQTSIFLLGTRIQNLYSNGVSRSSRSVSLDNSTYGTNIVETTPVYAYLIGDNDNINTGDDVIEFKPTGSPATTYSFIEQFSLVEIGDIIRVTYGLLGSAVEVPFLVKEKKCIVAGGRSKYIIRIAGKNLYDTRIAYARIDRALYNRNKYGVLAVASANTSGVNEIPTLIVGNPRSAMVLGVGFNPDLLDSSHYLLYLALYPTGHPQDGYKILPAIDVTGNLGVTPGKYTLNSVITSINDAFRMPGFNYRFIAFEYQGELGIMLADSYNNAGFSILNAVVNQNTGAYDETATNVAFLNNVVGVFSVSPLVAPDPLGFGFYGADVASPPFMTSYGCESAAQIPTKIFLPLKRNTFYVNGSERDTLSLDVGQVLDGYGDGYWVGTIISRSETPGVRVETTYRVDVDLTTSRLRVGSTLVVQSLGNGDINDYGRFTVTALAYGCSPGNIYTDITVYDAVHATGISPTTSSDSGTFAIYFGYDSVAFNEEHVSDATNYSAFKRNFEIYVDQNGKTFTHERGRINVNGTPLTVNGVTLYSTTETSKINILEISPKLRGYQFGTVNKISLMLNLNSSTGVMDGYLSSYDGATYTHAGPIAYGRQGAILRVYDETNIDYVEIFIDANTSVSTISNELIDIQLFPSLASDDELMLLALCQLSSSNRVDYVRDKRQFGNISEKDLSTSALSFIVSGDKELHANGIVSGFDLLDTNSDPNPNGKQIYLNGGIALVNGNLIQKNAETVVIPAIQELNGGLIYGINWALCINDKGEYQPIPLLDYDSSVPTLSSSSRTFKAYNPATAGTYYLDAITFSDIINKRKDLAIIYVITSKMTILEITLTVHDARRFVNSIENEVPLSYNNATQQGNFKTVDAIFNWLKFNQNFNGTAFIKGTGEGVSVDSDIILNSSSQVTIDGQNNAILTMNGAVTLGSNITFKNLYIAFVGSLSIMTSLTDLKFENCTISLASTALSTDMFFDFQSASNITFQDCTITASFTEAQSEDGAVIGATSCNNLNIIDTSITTTFAPSTTIHSGNIITLRTTPNVEIKGCSFSGNFLQTIDLDDACDNVKITDSTFESTFDPNTKGSNTGFDGTDLVNTGYGYIHASFRSLLNNIKIDNVTFNYNGADKYRFSFINFELAATNSILSNVQIINCKFNHLQVGSTIDDIRAAIAIINIAPVSGDTYPTTSQQPTIKNINISNNITNRNQAIILTSVKNGTDGYMGLPALVAINCNISNNTCGTIGYWVGSETKVANLNPNVNTNNDMLNNLIIDKNVCHYIGTLNSTGSYFGVLKSISTVTTDMCAYPSGKVTISNNTANWIHSAITYERESSLKILYNSLSAYSTTYLGYYGDTAPRISNAAIFVGAHNYINNSGLSESNDCACIIQGNTTSHGHWITTSSTTTTYTYSNYYIVCHASAIISNNILKGISTGSLINSGIQVSGKNSIITGNKIFREDQNISSYVSFFAHNLNTTPAWTGQYSYGLVVDNYFDSYLAYTGQTDDLLVVTPSISVTTARWTVERNINQTVSMLLMPIAGRHFGATSNSVRNYWTLPTGLSAQIYDTYGNDVQVSYNSSSAGGNELNYNIIHELTHILPKDVKIVYVAGSVTPIGWEADSTYYQMMIYIEGQLNGGGQFVFTDGYDIDGYASATIDLVDGIDFNTHISPILIKNDVGGKVRVAILLKLQHATDNLYAYISPMTVKYRW